MSLSICRSRDVRYYSIAACYTALLFFFFFQCSVPHRHLHSFPTRRSSDLHARSAASSCWNSPSASATACAKKPSGRRCRRSEEHTSELQSRGHLVCRLLLEKKKKHARV